MTGISLRYGSLSLSLFGFFFVWNWIGILGFLLGLLGLLKFGFVKVFVQFFFFFFFLGFCCCTKCLEGGGGLVKFFG